MVWKLVQRVHAIMGPVLRGECLGIFRGGDVTVPSVVAGEAETSPNQLRPVLQVVRWAAPRNHLPEE